jgi:hypothetical protein
VREKGTEIITFTLSLFRPFASIVKGIISVPFFRIQAESHGASVRVGIAFFNSSTACGVIAVSFTTSFLKFFKPLR